MRAKGKLVKRPITDFIPVVSENDRYFGGLDTGFGYKVDTYALAQLEEEIIDAGRIHTALEGVVKGKKVESLRGNRRTLAGQHLYELGQKGQLASYALENFPALFFTRTKDKNGEPGPLSTERNDRDPEAIAKEVMASLQEVPVELHEQLSMQEREEIIHDKGGEKRIRKSETFRSVCQLATRGFSEKQIARLMYHLIGDVTGNVSKIDYINSLSDPRTRDKELISWLHGTLGGFWLDIWGHSKRMRDITEQTFLRDDNLVPKDQNGNVLFKPEFYMTHTRWRKLRKALKEDASKGVIVNGKAVTENSETSPAFEALIVEFKKEDEGEKPDRVIDTRKKKDDLLKLARQAEYNPVAQLALRVAAGDADGAELIELCKPSFRVEGVMDTLKRAVDFIPEGRKFSGKEVNDLLNGVLRDDPLEFQKVILPFLSKEGQAALQGKTVKPQEAATVTA